ncbi:hypothetical protein WQ54_13555 [Bacillus sp. SA1-12]|nr:hypothetical protein WQ54_13555 [Bacillus sp. SA1-12]
MSSFLVIEQAPYYQPGDILPLKNTKMVFGRESIDWKPDITFNNIFVSRKHFTIYFDTNAFFIKDLQSKHGTFINGKKLEPHKQKKLRANDKISFAKDLVLMTFSINNFEETSDFLPITLDDIQCNSATPTLDRLKQQVVVDCNCYTLTEKEYKFIELLLQNNQFVSKEEVIQYVWSERFSSNTMEPMVSLEEINALVYRLRKKLPETLVIETIRGKGYYLKT